MDSIGAVIYEESIDKEAIDYFHSLNQDSGLEFHKKPDKGMQASILLLTASGIAIVFATAFAKKLGEKVAEDSWDLFKKGLKKIHGAYFGKKKLYEMTYISSGVNKVKETKYSTVFSIYCITKSEVRVKFLFETNWEIDEFQKANTIYLDTMNEYYNSSESRLQEIYDTTVKPRSVGFPILVAVDLDSNKLIEIDPFKSST
jgi:hypothetical protein